MNLVNLMNLKGFTMLEVVIVLALTVIVITMTSLNFFRVKAGRALRSAMEEAAAAVRGTREKAITQENGSAWGVRFWNLPAGGEPDYYEVFYGNDYGSGTAARKYVLRGGAGFSSPPEGEYADIVFNKIRGDTGKFFSVILVPPGEGSSVGEISILPLGQVKTRVDRGLAGRWKFDEGTGSVAYDSSSLGNHGTLQGGVLPGTNCISGQCLIFDGNDDYVDVGDPTSGILDFDAGDFSMTAWVYIDALKNFNVIFQKQPGTRTAYEYTMNAGGNIQYDASTCADTVILSPPFIAGSWQHLALVNRRGVSLTVYRNGFSAGSAGICTSPGFNAESFSIGKTGVPYGGYFDGQIDDARIYDRALSAEEVEEIYNYYK